MTQSYNLSFRPAYIENKCSLRNVNKKQGVYFIRENGQIVYIGMSRSCLYKAMYRHFQEWSDSREFANRVTYKNKLKHHTYDVSVVLTDDPLVMEKVFIIKCKPRDNRNKFENVEFNQEYQNLAKDIEINLN